MRINGLIAAAILLAALSKSFAADKPNIVVILADDLGYGDMRCNNPQRGKIPTPNIDRPAQRASGESIGGSPSTATNCGSLSPSTAHANTPWTADSN